MVNSVLDAVTEQLGKTFGDKYHYYVEDIEQNLIKPCFTVDTVLPLMRSRNLKLYDRTMPLVIHYYSDNKRDLKKDCYGVAERVLECLEYLPFNDTLLRGEDMSWHMVDDVLQIFVTYKFRTMLLSETEDNMEEVHETITKTQ